MGNRSRLFLIIIAALSIAWRSLTRELSNGTYSFTKSYRHSQSV